MAWEKRRNGKLYYYRSRRERGTGRVVKEYCGRGLIGAAFAAQDELDRAIRKQRALDRQEEEARAAEVEKGIADFYGLVEVLSREVLHRAGYHRHHRGEWRRRRHGTPTEIHSRSGTPGPEDGTPEPQSPTPGAL